MPLGVDTFFSCSINSETFIVFHFVQGILDLTSQRGKPGGRVYTQLFVELFFNNAQQFVQCLYLFVGPAKRTRLCAVKDSDVFFVALKYSEHSCSPQITLKMILISAYDCLGAAPANS